VHFFAFISRVFDMRQLDIEDIGFGIVSHGSHRRAPRSKKTVTTTISAPAGRNTTRKAAALGDAAPCPSQRWIVRIEHKSRGLSYRGLNPYQIDGITHDVVASMTGQDQHSVGLPDSGQPEQQARPLIARSPLAFDQDSSFQSRAVRSGFIFSKSC